jgi:hypothetical protein
VSHSTYEIDARIQTFIQWIAASGSVVGIAVKVVSALQLIWVMLHHQSIFIWAGGETARQLRCAVVWVMVRDAEHSYISSKVSGIEPTSHKALVHLRAWRICIPIPLLQLIVEVEVDAFVVSIVDDSDMVLFIWPNDRFELLHSRSVS